MFKKIKIFFNEIFKPMPLNYNFEDYDGYWKKRGFHKPSLRRAEIISKFIKPNAKILDIGCGDGTVMEYLDKHNKPKEIMGIDISQSAINYVRQKKYKAYKIDVLSNEFARFIKNKKFDYIIITELLEHISDPEKIIIMIKSHLNASLFVSMPNVGFFVHRIRLLFGKFPVVIIVQHIKEHLRFWTMKDFIYWSAHYGYKVDNINATSGLHFKPLSFLENIFPSLFANQILYELSIKSEKNK